MSNDRKAPEMSKELVHKHLVILQSQILRASIANEEPFAQTAGRTFGIFGLIPHEKLKDTYVMVPQMYEIAMQAYNDGDLKEMPPAQYNLDEGLIFCAIQVAMLESEGKMDEFVKSVENAMEELTARAQRKSALKIVDDNKPSKKDDGDDDPTFH